MIIKVKYVDKVHSTSGGIYEDIKEKTFDYDTYSFDYGNRVFAVRNDDFCDDIFCIPIANLITCEVEED